MTNHDSSGQPISEQHIEIHYQLHGGKLVFTLPHHGNLDTFFHDEQLFGRIFKENFQETFPGVEIPRTHVMRPDITMDVQGLDEKCVHALADGVLAAINFHQDPGDNMWTIRHQRGKEKTGSTGCGHVK